jgi:hypothetical protein
MTPDPVSGPRSAAHQVAARKASQAAANAAANRPEDKDVQALAEDLREQVPAVVPPSLPGVGAMVDVYAGTGKPGGSSPPVPNPKEAKAEEKEDPPYDPLGARWERVMEAPELPYLRPLREDAKGRNFDSTL